MHTRQQTTTIRAFVQKHAVLLFFALVFALFAGTVILGGPGASVGTDAQATSPADLSPLTYLSLVGANLVFALAAILVIALGYGRAGLRDLRSRLLRWRVGGRWYAVALLTAPVLMTVIVGALSLRSKDFLPAVVTSADKASLLAAGLAIGVFASFLEEIGWTGLAAHELLKRHGVLATGVLLGLLWSLMHLTLVAGTSSGTVPPVIYVSVALFVWPPAYRVLMVWVYAQTHSLLIAMLMHLPIIVCLFVLSPATGGGPDLVFNLLFGATLWALVAAVVATDHRKRSREFDQPRAQAEVGR